MYDFMEMQIIHPTSNSRGPIHEQPRCDLSASSQDFVKLSVGTVLHDDAVAWGLGANSPLKKT